MAASLLNTASLANDPGFNSRVEAAMMTAAVNVSSEAVGAQDAATYQLRHTLAVKVLNSPQSWLSQFTWASAANPTISADLGLPVSIASSTASNPSTVTTATVHGLSTGAVVQIAGSTVNTAINGNWPVTVVSTTVFTVPTLSLAVGGSGSTVTLQPPDSDIQFAVNSLWSDMAGVGSAT